MKTTKLMTLDSDVVDKVKEMGLNVSGEVNEFLKKRVGQTITAEEKDKTCQYCNEYWTEEPVWLYPEERWCCSKCLRFEVRKVMVAVVLK